MTFKFKALGGLLVIFATAIAFPAVAKEEMQTPNYEYETANEVFERAYFKNDPNFFGNTTTKSNINFLVGPGSLSRSSFPEKQIARDAELVNLVYRDTLYQQVSNDPYLRTPDLPNPYNTSLLMSPGLNASKLKVGTEFRFEQMPPR
ncbi:MAG: hypothetical protein HXY43_13505 [Fischerella sp.]|jgi:hypothetical protein|uniref:hypothetical protein n=1 Tax=Fischerella sp. TaxID=1191 RepID=UPI0017BB1487|nr:hypothetical protein [Fischerella sp.]NWF60242.1 hypothetical protein [Fischerella sp.]